MEVLHVQVLANRFTVPYFTVVAIYSHCWTETGKVYLRNYVNWKKSISPVLLAFQAHHLPFLVRKVQNRKLKQILLEPFLRPN